MSGLIDVLIFFVCAAIFSICLLKIFGPEPRANIPQDLRTKFESKGEMAFRLVIRAGQASEPWDSEIAAILRDEQRRNYLLAWLKEQR